MNPNHLGKTMPDSSTTKHFPEYKYFLFGGTVTLYVGQDGGKMEIHKKLLASISPELNKHVNNDMREGAEGIIRLPDEEEETVTLFAEWAYTGEYGYKGEAQRANTGNCTKLNQDPWQSLHKHLQLYVFSDKFNVSILKQLAETRFHAEIGCIEPKSDNDVSGLVAVIGYAYDNLPNSDTILKFLAQYASWKLELLRPADGFSELILAQPELLKQLLMNLKGPNTKPTAAQMHPAHNSQPLWY
ncbi:hypothetical protein HOY80DRAFT_1025023 [Tuber brumale]|nr:hypothetical protein HOY80DRAFT_1025023 [Tuber brumale]